MINFGSFILVVVLIYGLIIKTSFTKYIKLLIFFSLYLNIGYFIRIGTFEISYSEFLLIFCIILGLTFVGSSISKKTLLYMVMFFLIVFWGYFNLASNPSPPYVLPSGSGWDSFFYGRVHLQPAQFEGSHIIRIFRVVIFFVFYYIFDKYILINDIRTQEIKSFIVKSAKYIAYFGIFEQLVKLFISPTILFNVLNSVFGVTSSQLTWYVERGGLPILQGLMLEPGHYAQSFIPAILIVFLSDTISQKQKTRLLILFTYVIFFSGSFAGVAIIALMILIYTLYDRKNRYLKIAILFIMIILVIATGYITNSSLFSYYSARVGALISNNNIGSSESVRSLSLRYAIQLIKDYPMLGVGLGTTNVFGLIPSILVNIGLIGSVIWFQIMYNGFSKRKKIKGRWILLVMLAFIFMGDIGDVYSMKILLIFSLAFRKSEVLTYHEESPMLITI